LIGVAGRGDLAISLQCPLRQVCLVGVWDYEPIEAVADIHQDRDEQTNSW